MWTALAMRLFAAITKTIIVTFKDVNSGVTSSVHKPLIGSLAVGEGKLAIRLLAVGGDHSIPAMGESLRPYFQESFRWWSSRTRAISYPEEQPEALAKVLFTFTFL
jgi:hypothetical protein